jgi:peroxiredoxin
VVIVLVARLALAAVFVVGAVAKLGDRAGVRRSVVAFGAPGGAAGALRWALFGGELAVAAGLLFGASKAAGAVGALALLAILSVVVAANMVRGRTPDCHCFGRLSRGPVGWSTVARNALLSSIAGYVAVGGQRPLLFAALALAACALWLGLGPLRSRVRRGRSAPGFSLTDQTGARWTLEALLERDVPVLLIFSQPACGACIALLPDVARLQAQFEDRLTVAVISQAPRREKPLAMAARTLSSVLIDESGTVALDYGVTAAPSAVLVDRGGRIAAASARGAGEIIDLIAALTETGEEPRFARRTLIGRAARAVASLGALPLLPSACGTNTRASSRPNELHVAGTYVCEQRYALCTNSSCVPSQSDPSIVICDCVVESGYSIGLSSCRRRAPRGNTVYSTFSTQLVTSSTRVMTCPASSPWANCLDVICKLDPGNPDKARCQCLLIKTGPSVTFGGDCNTRTCSSVIWSAASSNLAGSTQLVDAMKHLGQPLAQPGSCPSS